MPIEFDWDAANTDHIARHGVSPTEAEQVLNNSPFDLPATLRGGEQRTVNLGESDAGRVLIVVATIRDEKVRVVTAYPAVARLRRLYDKLKAQSDEQSGSKLQD